VLKAETDEQHLESHLGIDMRERRAVEVEPKCSRWAVFDALQPHEGGLSVDETAEVLNVSPQTVLRDWKFAKAWLMRELR